MASVKGIYAPAEAQVDTATLATIVRSGAPVLLLDARSAKFDDGNRIPGARSLPSDSDDKTIRRIAKSKRALIVTYCSNLHCPASAMLYRRLKELGYENVLEYHDGIAGWKAASLPVEKARKRG